MIIHRDIYEIVADYEEMWNHILDDYCCTDWELGDDAWERNEDLHIAKTKPHDESIVLNKEKDEEFYYINKYKLGFDVDEIVQELIDDDRFSNHEKSCIFMDMTDTVMRRLENYQPFSDYEECQRHNDFLKSIDWERFISLCRQRIKFAQEYGYDYNTGRPYEDPEDDISASQKYITIAEAMLGNDGELHVRIDYATSEMLTAINEMNIDDVQDWKALTQFNKIYWVGPQYSISNGFITYAIGYYALLFRNLRKNELILPSLIQCANALENKISENKEEVDRIIASRCSDKEYELTYDVNAAGDAISLMYNWYRAVAECAIDAYLDVGFGSRKGANYFETYTLYLNKMKSLTDTSFAFVKDTEHLDKKIQFSHFYCQYETIASICIEYYTQLFSNDINVEDFVAMIKADDRLASSDAIEICCKVSYEIFFEVERCWVSKGGLPAVRKYLSEYNWNRLEALLDAEEDYYLDDAEFTDDGHENWEIEVNNRRCDMYRALVYAILDDQDSFDTHMRYLVDYFKEDVDKADNLPWSFFVEFDSLNTRFVDSMESFIGATFEKLNNIEKRHLAMPYLLECAEYVHTHLKTLENYSETMMYNWYKTIVEFTFYIDIQDDPDGKWNDVWYEYHKKLDEMTNKDYEENL